MSAAMMKAPVMDPAFFVFIIFVSATNGMLKPNFGA